MTPQDKFIDIGLKLHIREWPGNNRPLVLVHGLSSNSRTWDAVAGHLAQAGHRVITVDLRGHGLSEKPDNGYDFATIATDLARLLQTLQLEQPILAGQSWGGNVLLEFGARYPALPAGLCFVDGGFIDLKMRPDATWEKVASELRPPRLNGTPRAQLAARIQNFHPEWEPAGVAATLANFETLPDDTVRPWLSLERHMAILRAMWEQHPGALYPQITAPTLICVAENATDPHWTAIKAKQVAAAQAQLPNARVHWFASTDHDIHVHRPQQLAKLLLDELNSGIWSNGQ